MTRKKQTGISDEEIIADSGDNGGPGRKPRNEATSGPNDSKPRRQI